MQNLEQNQHITEELWIALSNNSIRHQDYMKILEHTCDCTWCAEHLAEVLEEEQNAVSPPAYLTGQIMERIGRLDVQAQMSVKKKSRQLRLLIYGMKVGLAVAVSSFLVIVSVNVQRAGVEAWPDISVQEGLSQQGTSEGQEEPYGGTEDGMLNKMNRFSHDVTDKMNQFSDFLLNIIY